MSRVSRGFKARRRRKKILKLAKGFRGTRSRNFRSAVSVVHRALQFSYRDRRTKKRDFRRLWVIRINASVRSYGLKYSEFVHGMKLAGIKLDRSVLADLAVHEDQRPMQELVDKVRLALSKHQDAIKLDDSNK